MLKGMLEGCILKVVSCKDTYGYEISQSLQEFGFSNISEGTIYPLLLRLEKNGWITAEYRQSLVGPKRKYFTISQSGKEEMDNFYSNWTKLENAVKSLFQDGGNKDE